MLFLIICATVLSTATGVVSENQHQSSRHKNLQAHRIIASWDEAQTICLSEGAILASPINKNVLDGMKLLMAASRHNTYLIGTRMQQISGKFVSAEGIELDDLPVFDMLEPLDPTAGDCLAMDDKTISVVPCWTPLPYMCLFNNTNQVEDICSEGYEYSNSTGSCYKYHPENVEWRRAQMKCVAEGGHLAIINDANEARECTRMFCKPTCNFAIGMRDMGIRWMSVDYVFVEELYNVWEDGSTPGKSGNNCVRLHSTGQLDNYYCYAELPFLCEKPCRKLQG